MFAAMLPAAPPRDASAPVVPAPRPPNHDVLLALPPTATSASVLRGLRADGVRATPVADGIGVLDVIRTSPPGMLVLDLELPGPDPAAVLAVVQSEAPHVAVIAITPRERRTALLTQLRGDRDDYLLRPFAVDDLAARIKLRLQLVSAAATLEQTVLRQGEITADTETGEVTVEGRYVALSPTEFAMLVELLRRPGEVVPPDHLAREVWTEPASTNLVQAYISYLRRKIGPERIRTVRGGGYVLEP